MFTVLNSNVFNWFVLLSSRLIMEIITKDLGWSYIPAGSSYWRCRSVQYFPRQHYNNQDEADSMICNWGKLNPPGKVVSVSSGQQVLLRLYHWPLKYEYPKKVFHPPTRLGMKVDSFYWVTITIICSSVRTREILCRVSVKRHLVLRTLRLKRFESSHCFRLAWSWVWDENKSSGFLEE